jgi:hypothetical protein
MFKIIQNLHENSTDLLLTTGPSPILRARSSHHLPHRLALDLPQEFCVGLQGVLPSGLVELLTGVKRWNLSWIYIVRMGIYRDL